MNPFVHLLSNRIFPVAIRPGVTPVPIPNTMVKTWEADDTMLETAWESRWLPESLLKRLGNKKAYKIEQASGYQIWMLTHTSGEALLLITGFTSDPSTKSFLCLDG